LVGGPFEIDLFTDAYSVHSRNESKVDRCLTEGEEGTGHEACINRSVLHDVLEYMIGKDWYPWTILEGVW